MLTALAITLAVAALVAVLCGLGRELYAIRRDNDERERRLRLYKGDL